MVDNLDRNELGRTGGMAKSGASMEQPPGQTVKQGWNDFRAKVRQKWNQLTDKDIDAYQNRGRNDFVQYVHGRVGGDRSLVERDVDAFARDTNYRW